MTQRKATAHRVGSPDTTATERRIPLAALLAEYAPGSPPPQGHQQAWTWGDEEQDILTRECLCCGQPGHYQQMLEAHMTKHGLTEGVCLSSDGRVRDGHHRIVAARRLGIESIPLESATESEQRWLHDHGPVSWEQRTFGDERCNRG